MTTWTELGIDVPSTGGAQRKTTCHRCAGSRKHPKEKCLSINLDDEWWKCHHCGWSGNLKQGEQGRPQADRWKPPVYRRPDLRPRKQADDTSDKLTNFFLDRGISRDILTRYDIRLDEEWMPSLEAWTTVIQIPYFRDGQVINIKSRSLIGKSFKQVFDAEKILYGLDDIKGSQEAIIVEGEMDKLAFAQAGIFHVLSVPDGAPPENSKPSDKKFEYLGNCEAQLNGLTKIILAVDSDGPGQELERELMRRLGPERCWIVRWPDGVKDANDMLLTHGIDGLCTTIEQAQPSPIEHVLSMGDLYEPVMAYYVAGRQRGFSTGFTNLDDFFTVAPGEFTVVTGIPSHGKSEFMDAVMINMIRDHGFVFAICSPENRPTPLHLAKLAEKIIGKPFLPGPTERMSPEEVQHALDWLAPHLYVLDSPEPLSITEVIKKARALVLQKGITHLILDPWNEFDHARPGNQTETDYISVAISQMKTFGMRSLVHTFVIAHPTKLQRDKQGKYPMPTPYDIAGSANWRNKPDNAITVLRPNIDIDPHYSEIHITKIRRKQHGRLGLCGLQWDPLCGRYSETALRGGA